MTGKNRRCLAGALTILALWVVLPLAIAQNSLIESICLVTNEGRINDGTFNESTYNGFRRAAADFGLAASLIESASQVDFPGNISTCVEEGHDAVITVGFPMADATAEFAAANPQVYFIGIDQFHDGAHENLVGLLFREDQGGFLAGAMAALMSESGIIAGVYGPAIPPVVRFRSGFEQGARFIQPDIVALGVHVDSFAAPDRGAAAAEGFIGEGADVILGAGGRTGSGGILAAARLGVFVIGVDQDEFFTTFGGGQTPGAEFLITSALKRVDNAVYLTIQSLIAGGEEWVSGVRLFTAADGGIGFAPANQAPVPAAATEIMDWIYRGLQLGLIQTGVDPNTGELLAE